MGQRKDRGKEDRKGKKDLRRLWKNGLKEERKEKETLK